MFNLNSLSKQIGFGYALILSIFVISLIVTLNQLDNIEATSDNIKDLRSPTARSSLMLLNGINHSLAALRGWMLIGYEEGGEKFKHERKYAWTEEITKSIDEMNLLSANWTNPENIKHLRSIQSSLKEFESYQNHIEKIANSTQNREASEILFTEAAPKAAVLMAEITQIIELEKTRDFSINRQNLLAILANVRGSFASCLTNIRAFILSGDEKFKAKFDQQWLINSENFSELALKKNNLNAQQLVAYEKFSRVRAEFSYLPEQMFEIRSSESWDKAKYLLKNKAAPLAFEIKAMLKKMVENQDKLQTEDYLKTHRQFEQLKWLLIVLLLIGSISSVVVGLKFIRGIQAPLNDIIDIIKGMSRGQFNLSFKESHVEEIRLLSESVQLMKDKLLEKNVTLEEEKNRLEEEDWIKSSLASILEKLPGHIDLENFSYDLLNNLLPKINGLVGMFYIKHDEGSELASHHLNNTNNTNNTNNKNNTNNNKHATLSLIGSYACSVDDLKKAQKIILGEGLVGQCALNQKTIYVSNLSDDYLLINSGLGKIKANNIVLLPILFEGEILGVVEIGTSDQLSTAHKGLIEQIIKNIGIILQAVLSRIETEKLLQFLNTQNQELNQHTKNLVNAQKLAEAANKDLAAQKTAMDQHSLVSVTDIKGIITYANDRFCDVSGYSRDELIGQNHRILNSNNQPENYWREMFLMISKGEFWHDEVCNKAKDGHLYWVDTTIVPLYDSNNKLSGYTSIRTDISPQKEIIARLDEAKKQADVANNSKTDFLANMSHEIRTPMNGVIGMTNLLLDTKLNQEQHHFAKTVKNSAESLLIIINDILDFSKVEAGMLELEPLEFDLEQLLHELGSGIAFRAHGKGLELICPANLMKHQWFIGDSGRIRQILTNLIGNAIKFTEQGEVAVYCKVQERTEQKTQLLFEISDTGIGLSKAEQEKLFERFSQADSSTTRKYGGTGLGLSISKQLVKLMDGEIGVKNNHGNGATFWFTLNLDNATKKSSHDFENNLHDKKVLIVNDNVTNRTLLSHLLTNWQMEFTLVDSDQQALKKLAEGASQGAPYHIVIMDMQMSGIDGIQLADAIKKDCNLPHIHLVVLTSQGLRGDAEKLKKAGFAGYLSKPIDQSVLYNTLIQVVEVDTDTKEKEMNTSYRNRDLPQFNARVLVVEDNAINQRVAQGLLKKFGIQADVAANGEEALHMLKSLPFDLVFMDCQMPVMDGYEASRNIRDSKSNVLDKTVPIIAMTANTMQGDREKCLAVGMSDFISKPVDPMKLQEALLYWLPECKLEATKLINGKERSIMALENSER